METAKAYVNENNLATVVCASCGRKKIIDAARFSGCAHGVRIKCACSFTFTVLFEKRRYYRKNSHLNGKYYKAYPASEAGEITVHNLSRTGVRFTIHGICRLKVDEIIKVTIVLDDKTETVVSQNAVVRRVEGLTVAAQFCDHNVCKPLAFYLMP